MSVTIERKGTKIILPTDLPTSEAVAILELQAEEETRIVNFHQVIDGAAWADAAVCFMRALRQVYGWTGTTPTLTMFGPRPPGMLRIPTGPDTYETIPWGSITVPGIKGHLCPSIAVKDGTQFLAINGTFETRSMQKVEAICDLTRELLKSQSIYRGKAVALTHPSDEDGCDITDGLPAFFDTYNVDEDSLFFSKDTREFVEMSLFTPIEKSYQCTRLGVPLRRGILLEGPYGTGKTLTAAVTAKKANRHGWTFVHVKNADMFANAVEFARRYQPAVVFCEDIDTEFDGPRDASTNTILNTLDGVSSKNDEVIVVLTTNNIEKIHPAMLRPGRLDAIVSLTTPDRDTVEKLLRFYGSKVVSPDDDLSSVSLALEGQIPAVIREVVERAKLATISRGGESVLPADLMVAARSVSNHVMLASRKPAEVPSDRVEAARVLASALKNGHNTEVRGLLQNV